ncbi:MAG: PadR family transcriptional regulator [Synergistaceae bacterium]|jgi:PadR family transcriptional regulator PadR|nr:PadR family transcriptional regulator [Synergistaceae bacterium]
MIINTENEEIRVWVTQIRKGIAELCVLACLREGEAYGYELLRRLKSHQFLSVTEGTLYPILNRAAESGWVALEHRASVTGPPRRYYSLTAAGFRRLNSMIAAWADIGASVEELLNKSGGI